MSKSGPNRREFLCASGAAALAAAAGGNVHAAEDQREPPVPRNSKIIDHFMSIADDVQPKLAWNATTAGQHASWRKAFRARLVELLGRDPKAVPLQVHWDKAQRKETDAFMRHKIYVQTEPNYWAPAYYFVPKRPLAARNAAVICLHGHSGVVPYIREGDAAQIEKAKKLSLDYAVKFAEEGYHSIAIVQRGWNETKPATENGCHRMTIDSFLIGMAPVGLRVWDAMRMVDFLQTQPDVDGGRIATAGLSGGGTTGLFFAALDDRIKAAMIAGYYCTFRDSIYTIYHCICNCIPHMMEWGEMSDIAALIAPRPMLVISGSKDDIFPIDAVKRATATLSKTYKLLGAGGNLDTDFFEGPHAWSHRKVPAFLKKHFG